MNGIIERHMDDIAEMIGSGASLKKVGSVLGVSASELRRAIGESHELAESIREARIRCSVMVQKAFFEGAVGTYKMETTSKVMEYPNSESRITETREKWIPPNPKVLEMLLHNTDDTYTDRDSIGRGIDEAKQKLMGLEVKAKGEKPICLEAE